MESAICKFCGTRVNIVERIGRDIRQFNCPICGEYSISYEAYVDLPVIYNTDSAYLYSGVLREKNELKLPIDLIRTDNIYDLIRKWNVPKTVKDKLDRIILHLDRKSERYDKEIELTKLPYSIGYARDILEFSSMLEELKDQGYIRKGGEVCGLTFKGHEYAGKLKEKNISSKQGFVAMWIDAQMNGIYQNYISKAIKDAGYEPMYIDAKEFNDEVCDHIIAEIRKSKFLVADFTGNRDGVYYEAGFARGLGLEVICTCREDWFNKTPEVEVEGKMDGEPIMVKINEERKIHFDIDHRKFIVWKDGKNLYEQLRARIEATIGRLIV